MRIWSILCKWRCSRARDPPITNGERTLLSAWLKQRRDWLMLWGRVDLVLQIFFPKFENNFEADFSRVEVCVVFASRSPLGKSLTLALEKSHSKPFSDFGKKIYKAKPALPNNFSLGPKGIWEVFEVFVFLKLSRAGISAMRPTRNQSRGARIRLVVTANPTNPMIPRRLIKRSTLLR